MNELEKENACGHAVRATDPIARKPHRSPTELDGQLVIVMAHASAVERQEPSRHRGSGTAGNPEVCLIMCVRRNFLKIESRHLH